jgi:hypothetical protein
MQPQRSFDVDMERKLWTLDTKTSALLPRTLPQPLPPAPTQPPPPEPVVGVLTHAHQLISSFRGVRPLTASRASSSRSVSLDVSEQRANSLSAADAVALPLNVLQYMYVANMLVAAAFVPTVLQEDPAQNAPYHISALLLPLLVATVTLHGLLCFCMRRRYTAYCACGLLLCTLPVALSTLQDLHGSLLEGRFAMQMALLHLQVFLCAALPRRQLAALALTVVVFAMPVCVSESAYAGQRDIINVVFFIEAMWCWVLSLLSTRPLAHGSASVRVM